MDHSLKVINTEVGKEGVLSLMGNVTVAEARETQRMLLEAIQQTDTLFLDLARIEAIDVSFIQLLCASHRECFLSQKKIYIQGEISDAVNIFLAKAGYVKQHGCFAGAQKSCLWNTSCPGCNNGISSGIPL